MGKVAKQLLTLSGPFTRIARTMSGQWHVNVIPSGTKCATDGNNIYIPFTADYLPPEWQQALHGHLDHELGHVMEERVHKEAGRTTPLQLMARLAKSGRREDRIMMHLINVYEDIRIEYKYGRLYPGMGENLRRANMLAMERFRARTESRTFWDELGCLIINKARDQDISWGDPKVVPYLDELAPEITAARRTTWADDSWLLAHTTYEKIVALAEAAESTAPEDSSEGSEDDTEEGGSEEATEEASEEAGLEEGLDDSSEEQDTHPDDEEGGSEDGSEGGGSEGSEGSEEGSEDGSEGSEGSEEGGSEDGSEDGGDLRGAARRALSEGVSVTDHSSVLVGEMEEAVKADALAHHRYIPNPIAQRMDSFPIAKPERAWRPGMGQETEAEASERALAQYRQAFDDVSSQIGALRGRQQSLLQTMTRRRILPGLDSGRLDDAALALVRTGDRRVFTDVSPKKAIDTAIEVLIDLSGSMGDNTVPRRAAYYAERAAIALAESWEPLGVPYEIIGFYNAYYTAEHPETHATYGKAWGPGAAPPGTVPRAPLVMPIFKGWNERLSNCRERFASIRGYEENADGEAVFKAAQRLAVRKEKRRILVVISDGSPCHPDMTDRQLGGHLRDVVTAITAAGIEVWGIGAGTDAPKSYYNERTGAKNIIIRDLSKLAETLFKAIQERLVVS